MLILDELKRNDPQLRLMAVALAAGLAILLAGLWWVQIVSTREYQGHLEMQSYRTVRLPAIRGKILDRNGRPLAENRPRYNLSLYLDDLRKPFDAAYGQLRQQGLSAQKQALAAEEKKLGRSLTKAERKQFALTAAQREQYRQLARYRVASGLVSQIGQDLNQSLTFDPANFERDYKTRLALPYTVIPDANPVQVARFEEKFTSGLGADLDVQPVRVYPCGATAGHLLGYLQRDDSSVEGEEAYFSYRLPDYRGVTGVEWGFDSLLRGRAGGESVLVNSQGYRESENILESPEPGHNVVLTIDLELQRAAEESFKAHRGAEGRGAVVVMDVRTGDVLAMVSSPAINPVYSANDPAYLSDAKLRPQINRATQQNYAPGSIFKPIIALAALEDGLDPDALVDNPGYIYVGQRHIKDLAAPGQYNLRRAIIHSSNSYFITAGLRAGIDNIIRIAEKFHFGERTGLPTKQETRGNLPTLSRVHSDWHDGDTANVSIGQGEIAITPMQMAVFCDCQRWRSFVAAARRAHRVARPGVRRSRDKFSVRRRA
jgi:penicillin-binding protein 2